MRILSTLLQASQDSPATARAPRNAVPAPAHRLNRADTIEQRSPRPHSKTGRTHPARGPPPAASTRGRHPPPHPVTTQTHHITATETMAQGETLSSSAVPSPLSRSRCR
ncbi:hypothetical protein XENOCAPTIV_015468 [Xenoophorus captivus]|uniref:Uncharacterized protein n=1 Tax=Xenoophorus captivus TaxID=1517983 RepID=A0ABV0R0J7_9TELE